MVNKSNVPLSIVCDHCGSSSIVPLLYGFADEQMNVLLWQEKIALGGCIVGGVGSHLWECVDCGKPITDKRFLMQETETFISRVYRQQLERAFAEYKPVSDVEYAALRGRWFIKSATRCEFKDNTTTTIIFKRLPDGFELKNDSKELWRQRNAGFVSANVFDDMLSFINQNSASLQVPLQAKLTARVGREEQEFVLSIEKPSDSPSPVIIISRVGKSEVNR